MRVFSPERNRAIMDEVDKLLATNFIREVYYLDWLAKVVMVKKANEKWKMCIDFTYLNSACSKDSFLLPRINQLVDSTAGHKLLTFIDAFSRYNKYKWQKKIKRRLPSSPARGSIATRSYPSV